MRVEQLTSDQPTTWYQRGEQQIFLADALDHTSDAAMTVGFARYRAGEANDWTVSYDEALVITTGAFTVRSRQGAVSARAGEVIYLRAGEEIVYQADEDTELVYVTHPHWLAATESSPHAAKLDEFHPVSSPS
jgi:ethanolamine utilization protein EutQ